MTVLSEGDLQITLPVGTTWRRFDDGVKHGLTHCMKAVDFIIELDDHILFIELKDPEHPNAQSRDQNKFIKDFLSGSLDADLKTKYRDSFLYEWASGRARKPIYYLVLIGASTLSAADLLARTDALKRQVPIIGPNDRPWNTPFIENCAVMNIAAWNNLLKDYPVSRKTGTPMAHT